MSKLKTNTIRHVDGSNDNITLDSSQNVTVEGVLKTDSLRHTGASSDAVTLASDGTCTAKITNNLSNRNLVINGAMQLAQRGTSSTTNGYGTVDRMKCTFRADADEACTQEQVDVASGTTPYNLGFRKAVKQTNGNQTSGAQAASYAQIIYAIEAQDIATSGWNYTSASSYITISFWARASEAATYTFHLETSDGTAQLYSHAYALSANTWTKITKTIPGNSNITINNDNGPGLYFVNNQYLGTSYTTSGHTVNTWAAAGSYNDMAADFATDWWIQNDATFEMTGLQIEVGDVATDFEHRTFADELRACERYYYSLTPNAHETQGATENLCLGFASSANEAQFFVQFPNRMRKAAPDIKLTTNTEWFLIGSGTYGGNKFLSATFLWDNVNHNGGTLYTDPDSDLSSLAGDTGILMSKNTGAELAFDAEL